MQRKDKNKLLSEPGINRIPDAFTQKVVAEHGDQDGHAREEREPPGDAEHVLALGEHIAPARCGRLDADAEERERRFGEYGSRDAQRGGNEHGCHGVGQDMAEYNACIARPHGLDGQHEVPLLQGQELGAHQARDAHP